MEVLETSVAEITAELDPTGPLRIRNVLDKYQNSNLNKTPNILTVKEQTH